MLVAPASPVTAAVQLLAAATQWKAESAGPAAYSKFAAIPVSPTSPKQIPSRQAMTIIYAPAFAAAAAALATSPAINGREALVAGMLTAHFAKRLVEVFFVHRYSGLAGRALSAGIGSYYALTVLLITSMQRGVESRSRSSPGSASRSPQGRRTRFWWRRRWRRTWAAAPSRRRAGTRRSSARRGPRTAGTWYRACSNVPRVKSS
mmetsp:Transcript_2812/g.8312  ORF Transcript_2812/g.8312 Transcript_2812/m.8312 type:complete len:205 (-) Transcript_2812:137-751(-)